MFLLRQSVYKFEDFGKDENEKVEEKIQMWILAGGSAEVASAFKKKRFLQKSLQDLFQNKTPLPDGMTIHFANTELTRLNKKYSSQFKDLLRVKNTSDVIRRGLAEDMARAALLLGKQPKREREAGKFSYIDEHHIGHDDDPYYGILDEDGKNINNLFGEKAESDSEEEKKKTKSQVLSIYRHF